MEKISVSHEFKLYINTGEIDDTEEARDASFEKAFNIMRAYALTHPEIVEYEFVNSWDD